MALINTESVNNITSHGFLSDKRYGFRFSKSTVNVYAERVQQALDKNCEVPIVALDSSKAVDRVWHDGLFRKLKGYDVPSRILCLIKSFLRNHVMKILLNGHSSRSFSVNAAAPDQVSIFVTNLFLIFIYALSDVINSWLDINAEDKSIVIPLSVSISVKRNARLLK